MLYQQFDEEEIGYKYGSNQTIKKLDQIYYDKNKVLKCPKCNNLVFYVENKYVHKCPVDNKTYELNADDFKNKSNEFKCNISNINFKCKKHDKEFLYYKNSNYYCSDCIEENNLEDYLNLDFIKLSKKEKEEFEKIILESEKIMKEINLMNEKYIQRLIDSNEEFNKRNKSLIEYCKGLLKFNEKYDKNYNLISTIRRISRNINDINELTYNNLINFYENENILKFNNGCKYKIKEKNENDKENENSYFDSENIIKKGEYYLGESISKGTFGEVFKVLSIKDKKIVAIKRLIDADDEEFINEVNILKQMNKCENSVKYLDSFKDKGNKYIVTELCDGNLRNLIKERKYGLTVEEIKKIFCQINEGFKYLNSKNLFDYHLNIILYYLY